MADEAEELVEDELGEESGGKRKKNCSFYNFSNTFTSRGWYWSCGYVRGFQF